MRLAASARSAPTPSCPTWTHLRRPRDPPGRRACRRFDRGTSLPGDPAPDLVWASGARRGQAVGRLVGSAPSLAMARAGAPTARWTPLRPAVTNAVTCNRSTVRGREGWRRACAPACARGLRGALTRVRCSRPSQASATRHARGVCRRCERRCCACCDPSARASAPHTPAATSADHLRPSRALLRALERYRKPRTAANRSQRPLRHRVQQPSKRTPAPPRCLSKPRRPACTS